MNGDPNVDKLTAPSVAGVPSIPLDGQEWLITDEGFDKAELKYIEPRCAFWRKIARKMPV